MKLSSFLTHVNYALRGVDDDTPDVGSDEANFWVATLNRVKNNLYENTKNLWSATYLASAPNEPGTVATTGTTTLTGTDTYFTDYAVGDRILVDGETVRTIATITSDTSLTVTVAFSNTASSKTFTRTTIIDDGVAEYSLHRSFIAPSNQAKIVTTSSQSRYLDFIHPEEANSSSRKVFVAELNPQKLHFTTEIVSTEDIVGGTLTVPGYYMPADVDADDEDALIPLPDPFWGVMATAAEIAFGDITYEDKAADLNGKAGDLYMQMVRKNRRGTHGNPRKRPNNSYRVRSTEVN